MLERFDTALMPPMPWKNGGGSTLEVARTPQDAGLDDFHWRVSIATIASSGPFSRFPGVDRTIVLLSGDGVHLHSADDTIDHSLDVRGAPFSFSGEADIDARLVGTASRDFNVMVRRPLRAEVSVLHEAGTLSLDHCGLLYADGGGWSADDMLIAEGQGLRWDREARTVRVSPLSTLSMLVAVRIR